MSVVRACQHCYYFSGPFQKACMLNPPTVIPDDRYDEGFVYVRPHVGDEDYCSHWKSDREAMKEEKP